METVHKNLAAAVRLGKKLVTADGRIAENELVTIADFVRQFDIDDETEDEIYDYSDRMDDMEAIERIKGLDGDSKWLVLRFFAELVGSDGELPGEEMDLYGRICNLCGLPVRNDSEEDEEDEEDEEEEETDEEEEPEVIPAFILVKYNGLTSLRQTETTDWENLEQEIASWLETKRVEIVRYTKPLNALTRQLDLCQRHLVFLVARNGRYDEPVGDNMPATLLYGAGYPIYGHALFCLETDDDYTIEGFCTQSLINDAFDAINEAVDGLLILETFD